MSRERRRLSPGDVVAATWRSALYGGSDRAVSGPPYIRDANNVRRLFNPPLVAATLALIASIYLFGWKALAVGVVAAAVGGMTSLVVAMARGRELSEGTLLMLLIYALLLPPAVPLWLVAGGAIIVGLAREGLGGLGWTVFHPALAGKAILLAVFPGIMYGSWAEPFRSGAGGFAEWASTTSAAAPLEAARQGAEPSVTDLLLGTAPGALGTTSGLLLILLGAWLLYTRAIDRRIAITMLGAVLLGQALFGMFFPDYYVGSPLVHLLAGGTLFAAILVATDPVTSPMTPRGKWIYGLAIGLLVVLLRAWAGLPEGVTFAVLAANLFVPLLDRWTAPRPFGYATGEAQ